MLTLSRVNSNRCPVCLSLNGFSVDALIKGAAMPDRKDLHARKAKTGKGKVVEIGGSVKYRGKDYTVQQVVFASDDYEDGTCKLLLKAGEVEMGVDAADVE